MVSSFAVQMFFARLVKEENIELQEVSSYTNVYVRMYENPIVKKVVDTLFSNETMLKAFPNLKVTTKNGDVILVRDILKDIQPYYFRVFTPPKKLTEIAS